MARQFPKGSISVIQILHLKGGPYVCIDCGGVEDVEMPNRQAVWKHLEDYHNWMKDNELLSIQET